MVLDHRVQGRLGGTARAIDSTGWAIRRRCRGARPSAGGMGRGWGMRGHVPTHRKSVCCAIAASAMHRHLRRCGRSRRPGVRARVGDRSGLTGSVSRVGSGRGSTAAPCASSWWKRVRQAGGRRRRGSTRRTRSMPRVRGGRIASSTARRRSERPGARGRPRTRSIRASPARRGAASSLTAPSHPASTSSSRQARSCHAVAQGSAENDSWNQASGPSMASRRARY